MIKQVRSLALMAAVAVAGLGNAGDAEAQVVGDFGARYWYSSGETSFDLYTTLGPPLVSRLTYSGLDAHSGEVYGRIQDTTGTFQHGLFVKGYAGAGIVPGGSLVDEDFPPVVVPYSNTISVLDDGNLAYFSGDVGAVVYRTDHAEIGVFTGYHYWNEGVHAFGCTQTMTSGICVPTIPSSVAVISNDVTWHSWRLGITGSFDVTPRLSLTGEAAWVPYSALDDTDNHHLRPSIEPLPIDGSGQGVQLEAFANFAVTEKFSVGVGGRYWHLSSGDATAHFERTPGGGSPQMVDFTSDRYGVFIQAGLKFP